MFHETEFNIIFWLPNISLNGSTFCNESETVLRTKPTYFIVVQFKAVISVILGNIPDNTSTEEGVHTFVTLKIVKV